MYGLDIKCAWNKLNMSLFANLFSDGVTQQVHLLQRSLQILYLGLPEIFKNSKNWNL